jgi:hypothetical protein
MKRLALSALLVACAAPTSPDDEVGESESTGESTSESGESTSESDESTGETSESEDESSSESETGEPATWRSVLYPEDWTPEFTHPEGHFLHDFSYAGYHNGEVELPTEIAGLERSVLDEGADPSGVLDSTSAIQATIDAVEQAGGGVVLVPAGSYRCDGLLEVEASHMVIRGEGPQSQLWFTRDVDMTGVDHLTFRGSLVQGQELPLIADGQPRSHVVRVADAAGLAPGDSLAVGWVITEEFVADHQMTDTWMAFNGQWRTFFRRELEAIECDANGCDLVLDVPLRYPALLRDQASVRVETGYLREVGVEHLAVSTVSDDWDAAWANELTHAIGMIGVADAWVRGVTSFESPNSIDGKGRHLMSGGIYVGDSKRVTIADSVMRSPQNRGGGGSGYLFEISRSNEVLTRDSQGLDGRHNFIQNWDFGTTGCVWLRVHTEGGRMFLDSTEAVSFPGYSDYHHSLALANLVDQGTIEDGWNAVNRTTYSSGAGHSSTQNVFWNSSGNGTIRTFQFHWGYVIGATGLTIRRLLPEGQNFESLFTEPEDWIEGLDVPAQLEPPSLYEDQLARRLGG